jgi:hypothetical protein
MWFRALVGGTALAMESLAVLRVSPARAHPTLDHVIDAVRSAGDHSAVFSALLGFMAWRWNCGVLLAVDGAVLRPSLAFGAVAFPEALGGLELPRDGTGSIATAARAPAVISQAAADPLLAQLLSGQRGGPAIALSIPRGFEVSHVLFACEPIGGDVDRADYAILLHELAQALCALDRRDQCPNRKPTPAVNSTDPFSLPAAPVGE